MVKVVSWIALLSVTFSCYSQNLSLGVGGRFGNHWVENNTDFNFDILDNAGDTLLLKTTSNGISVISGLSFPIYARFTGKRNWWVQVNYGYETWRMGILGTTVSTDYANQIRVQSKIEDLPVTTTPAEIEEFRAVYLSNVIDEGTYNFEGFERIQYNRLTFSVGSSVNKKGIVTFYYGGGLDLLTTSTFESYQGLVYDNKEVSLTHHILEAIPKLQSTLLAPFANFGIEKQNVRLGLDFTFYPSPVFGNHNAFNDLIKSDEINANTTVNSNSQTVKGIASVGMSLNYTLFNQNFNQVISADKRSVLDPIVIGRYRQKPKLIQYGLAISFPNFHNSGWSVIDDLELEEENDVAKYNDSLLLKKDNYLSGVVFVPDPARGEDSVSIFDYLYLEKQDEEIFVNEDGDIDTSFTSTTVFFALGNINSIVKSPKISGFVRINPNELFSADFHAGYQNHTYGIRSYETVSETLNGITNVQTRKLVYQENFHEISFGMNAYVQKQINNISQLGFHVGFNYNLWLNGRFTVEEGGINNSELLSDFHYYNTGQVEEEGDSYQDESKEWNRNENEDADKGVFKKVDYYNQVHNNPDDNASYHTDYEPYLFNTLLRRSYFEMRFGVDYYIENLKFNIYGERSLLRNNTMYSSLFSVGMGVAVFLN